MDYITVQNLLKYESLPCVVVDLDAFDRNIQRAIKNSHPHFVRIATKSIRVPALISRVRQASKQFQGLMCYSAKEMKFLADKGFDNFLLAYPTLQSSDLEIIWGLHQAGKKLFIVVDCASHLQAISQKAPLDGLPLNVIVEVDASMRLFGGGVHLGVRRSPIREIQQVLHFAKLVEDHKQLKLVGVMVYEAQVAGLTDKNPFTKLRNPIAHFIRLFSAKRLQRYRKELRSALEKQLGRPLELFNGGGTGSLAWAKSEQALTEVTMGSGLLCSHLFDYYQDMHYEPACFFALQVVRSSDRGWVTCQGGGYIASGAPGWDRWPRPWWPLGLKLTDMEGAGEVQTPLMVAETTKVQVGDAVFFRHAKAGELAERFNYYLLVQNGKIIDRVPTYRGLGLDTF